MTIPSVSFVTIFKHVNYYQLCLIIAKEFKKQFTVLLNHNDYFNIPKASKYTYKLPVNSQEAITTIYSVKKDFLNAAKEQVESEYGSIQTYPKRGIELFMEDIEQLRSILLTDNDC